jgi:hypothetical protein
VRTTGGLDHRHHNDRIGYRSYTSAWRIPPEYTSCPWLSQNISWVACSGCAAAAQSREPRARRAARYVPKPPCGRRRRRRPARANRVRIERRGHVRQAGGRPAPPRHGRGNLTARPRAGRSGARARYARPSLAPAACAKPIARPRWRHSGSAEGAEHAASVVPGRASSRPRSRPRRYAELPQRHRERLRTRGADACSPAARNSVCLARVEKYPFVAKLGSECDREPRTSTDSVAGIHPDRLRHARIARRPSLLGEHILIEG